MSVASIVKNNCCDIFKKIEKDVNRWTHASVPARIAVVKMNVLPRIHFISSMFPLAPPPSRLLEKSALLESFIWINRHSRIKWDILQRSRLGGGWAVLNVKLYNFGIHTETYQPIKRSKIIEI